MLDSKWFEDYGNVKELAQHLVDESEITTCEDLLYYFSKPWKWTEEWETYNSGRYGED